MTEETGINFLISKQHLTTPIIMKLAMLYNSVDENFVKKVVRMYYTPKYKSVYVKELRETLLFIKNVTFCILDHYGLLMHLILVIRSSRKYT